MCILSLSRYKTAPRRILIRVNYGRLKQSASMLEIEIVQDVPRHRRHAPTTLLYQIVGEAEQLVSHRNCPSSHFLPCQRRSTDRFPPTPIHTQVLKKLRVTSNGSCQRYMTGQKRASFAAVLLPVLRQFSYRVFLVIFSFFQVVRLCRCCQAGANLILKVASVARQGERPSLQEVVS